MGKRFDGSVVWITGGGSGIGRALALEMAREGATVVVSGRRVDKLEEVVGAIAAEGGRGVVVPCDVVDDAAVEAAVARIVADHGRLDVAVANAGVGVTGRFDKLTRDEWKRQFDVNVLGAASTARYALPALHESGGRFVFVASVAGFLCAPKSGAYCASKFAVRAMGLTLAQELHGTPVSCTTIHPGFVESEIALVDNSGVLHGDRPDPRPQKLMWPADKAARAMVDAIWKRKREYVFTGHGKVGAFVGKHFPGLVHFSVTRGGKKKAPKAG